MNFQMQLHFQAEINLYVSSFFPKDMSRSQRPSSFDQFVATRTKPVSEMFSFLAKKAKKTTVLPLWIFTNLFHQSFPKHCFLESMLELLQQFYIAIKECVDNYKNVSRQPIPTFYKMYEMSQLCLIKKSGNSRIAIESANCKIATF